MSAPAENDWIEWSGGECPVADDDLLQVQFRCETREKAARNKPELNYENGFRFIWSHDLDDYDIIAYRVVQP